MLRDLACVGHVGVLGSGKTALVRAIGGLRAVTGSTILLDGTPLGSGLRGRDRVQRPARS